MQPPILPPPPHPNFQSVHLHTELPLRTDPLFISNNQPPGTRSPMMVVTGDVLGPTPQNLNTGSQTVPSSQTPFSYQVSEEPDSQSSVIQTLPLKRQITTRAESSLKLPVSGPFGFLKLDSYIPTPTPRTQTRFRPSGSVTFSVASQDESSLSEFHYRKPGTKPSSHHETPLQFSQTEETHHQPSPTLSETSEALPNQTSFLPKFNLELPSIHPSTQPPPASVTKPPQVQEPSTQQHPQLSTASTIHLHEPGSSQLDSEVTHQVNTSDGLNATRTRKPTNNTHVTTWPTKSTSQSPLTSSDPRWVKFPCFSFSRALRSHICLSCAPQSDTRPIMAAHAGETWHPHRSGSGCISGIHLHQCYLLFCGPEERTCTNKPGRSGFLKFSETLRTAWETCIPSHLDLKM